MKIIKGEIFYENNSQNSGTLADLKRTRSQNRVAGSNTSSLNTSNNSLTSQNELEGIAMNPGQGSHTPSTTSAASHREPGVTLNPRTVETAARAQRPAAPSPNSRRKFAASSIEVVGPPSKSGCCTIL